MGDLDTLGGGKYRTIEDGQITSISGGNTFSINVAGRDNDYVGVNGTWYDADNQKGEDVRLGFIQGSAKLPVMITRGSRPRRTVVGGNNLTYMWPVFRYDYNRTNCIANEYTKGVPESAGLNFSAIIRDRDTTLYNFVGTEQVNEFGGALGPWFLLIGSILIEQEFRWTDFSVTADNVLIVVAEDDEDLFYEPHQWPEEAPYSDEEDSQAQKILFINSSGTVIGSPVSPPVRAVEYPDDPGGGGGDPGGGGGF